ncbi:hypothetical protein KFE25_010343 [Diacronema lutheri]|uniref:Peptidyl-prolyl cis-trans isomerase n=1 Tax=Diacronema lutheri TaxID=2081491 RepID=A0A8J6CCI4_DIALT|nr:hypothetical protein KFE25_010343 [Diacronema lutheri]
MSVLVETSKGDLVIDLHVDVAPRACENFLKLCKLKYYNGCLFHHVSKGRLVQTGDPTGTGAGGTSVWGLLHGERARFFDDELSKRLNHASVGTVSMATAGPNTNASQFVITTGPAMHRLDESHTIFGRVAEGLEALAAIDAAYVDADGRPYQNVRIKHTIILDDPFPDPAGLRPPDRSPSPTPEQLAQDRARLADDEALDEHEGKTAEELEEALAAQAAKSRAEVLEMLGDLPDADVAPPDNVLFVCKLNAVTQDDDLEIIFARFGDIVKCEVIRDAKTGESLNYAFVEFAHKEQCEAAYLKMDGALIDDRRIKVDFSQSVAKVWNRYRRNEPMAAMGGAGPGGGGGVGGGGGAGMAPPGVGRRGSAPGYRSGMHDGGRNGIACTAPQWGGGGGGSGSWPVGAGRGGACGAGDGGSGVPSGGTHLPATMLPLLPPPPPPPPPLRGVHGGQGIGGTRPSRWGDAVSAAARAQPPHFAAVCGAEGASARAGAAKRARSPSGEREARAAGAAERARDASGVGRAHVGSRGGEADDGDGESARDGGRARDRTARRPDEQHDGEKKEERRERREKKEEKEKKAHYHDKHRHHKRDRHS